MWFGTLIHFVTQSLTVWSQDNFDKLEKYEI